jgi:polysaccharide chain length determinant protein (PEP-CTERM system associated)
MPEKAETIKFDHYINLIFKHRWLIIIPFCLAMIVGIYLTVALPKTYEASTLIMIEPQRVPSNFVKAIVSTNIDSRINSIKEQILSYTNIEKIIDKFNLFTDPGSENMFMENKVASIKNRIAVSVSRARRGQSPNTFSISFKDANPETAMKIANGLTTLFIDENLKIREAQALGTSDFLEDEMKTMLKRLQNDEKKLRAYRARYRGELPEQLDSNLRILGNFQRQLSEREERLSDEKNRLIEIENQIQARKDMLATGSSDDTDMNALLTLEQLKKLLANLETSYTDRHPDVIRLRAKIANLEEKIRSQDLNSPNIQVKDVSETADKFIRDRVIREQMKQQMEIKVAIRDLTDDLAKLKRQITIYQQRVERTSKREEELLALNRDYKNIQQSYSSLLNRKLEAEISVNMEKKQKGEQFRIIDSARVPHEPVSPDLKKLFMMVVAAGLGLGAGLIFLLDFFDSSLKDPEGFESDLGVALLATVPKIYHKKDLRLKRLNRLLTVFSLLVGACLVGGFAALVFNGVEPTIEIVRPYIEIVRPYLAILKI